MSEKVLNTRIQLKYDSYSNWTTKNPVLKKGEVAIATIETNSDGIQNAPSILLKVGDGTNNYNALKFVSGLSADVYDWAKSATKPEYSASEITGLSDYISNEIQDTDTQYQIVKVDDYTYKLQSKSLDGSWTDVTDGTIVIPKYDDTAIKNDIAAIKDGTTIDSFADVEAALDGKQPAGDYATKSEAQGYANEKVASVTAKNDSVDIDNTAPTAPKIGVKIDDTTGNALNLIEGKGLRVEIPDADEYNIVKDPNSGDYAAVYHLTKNGSNIGVPINIPKDIFLQSATVVKDPEGLPEGKYIKWVLQNVEEPLYIDVSDLVEYVTSGSETGDMVVISISYDHKVTATITDGTITKAKLTYEIQTSLGKADSAIQTVTANAGLTATKTGTDVAIDFDNSTTFIFNCGDSTI